MTESKNDLDVRAITSLAELVPYSIVTGFTGEHSDLEGIDVMVQNIANTTCGFLQEGIGFLTVSQVFEYSDRHQMLNKVHTHANNPQTLKGVLGPAIRPSYALQPRGFNGKLINPRVVFLEPPEEIRGLVQLAQNISDDIILQDYRQENAFSIVAISDVPITGLGVVGTTVDRFMMWPYEGGSKMAMRRFLDKDSRTKRFTNGLVASEKIVKGRLIGSKELAEERRIKILRAIAGTSYQE